MAGLERRRIRRGGGLGKAADSESGRARRRGGFGEAAGLEWPRTQRAGGVGKAADSESRQTLRGDGTHPTLIAGGLAGQTRRERGEGGGERGREAYSLGRLGKEADT